MIASCILSSWVVKHTTPRIASIFDNQATHALGSRLQIRLGGPPAPRSLTSPFAESWYFTFIQGSRHDGACHYSCVKIIVPSVHGVRISEDCSTHKQPHKDSTCRASKLAFEYVPGSAGLKAENRSPAERILDMLIHGYDNSKMMSKAWAKCEHHWLILTPQIAKERQFLGLCWPLGHMPQSEL